MTDEQQYDPTAKDMAQMERIANRFSKTMKRWRAAVAEKPWLLLTYRIGLCIVSSLVIIAGILMLVLPGPGWLTIFLGLAMLGSEFAWARRILSWLRMQVRAWWQRYQQWRARRREAKAARDTEKR